MNNEFSRKEKHKKLREEIKSNSEVLKDSIKNKENITRWINELKEIDNKLFEKINSSIINKIDAKIIIRDLVESNTIDEFIKKINSIDENILQVAFASYQEILKKNEATIYNKLSDLEDEKGSITEVDPNSAKNLENSMKVFNIKIKEFEKNIQDKLKKLEEINADINSRKNIAPKVVEEDKSIEYKVEGDKQIEEEALTREIEILMEKNESRFLGDEIVQKINLVLKNKKKNLKVSKYKNYSFLTIFLVIILAIIVFISLFIVFYL